MGTNTWVFLGLIMFALLVGAYFLFRDTMNRIQYLERVGIYWITRDNATVDTPRVMRAIMRQTAPPYWRGRGVQFRFRRWTFQVGRLTEKVSTLDKQLGRGWLPDVEPKVFRKPDEKWGEHVQEEA